MGYDLSNCMYYYTQSPWNAGHPESDEAIIRLYQTFSGYTYLVVTGEDGLERRHAAGIAADHNDPLLVGTYLITSSTNPPSSVSSSSSSGGP